MRLSTQLIAIISVGFCIAIAAIFLYFTYGHHAAADNWQVDDDQYRKQITVTNNTSDQTSVYVSITIDTSDTNRFQADGGDIRFIKANGEILPYYISSGIGTTSTVINIYYDTLKSGPQGMYMYYGNSMLRDGFYPTNFSTAASSYSMGTPASEEKYSGPAGFWKFDQGTGTTAYDSSYNRNDGTLGGTIVSGVGSTANIIRQEINMIDATLSGTHTTAVSNALVQLDTTKYSGTVTYYFEIVGTATASSTGSIRLRRNGTSTDDATISTANLGTSTTRLRSSSFSPPAGATEYFLYVDDAGASKTVTIKSARIIIIQNQAGIISTEGQFEIGNQELAKTNTSTAALTNPKYWTYDDTHWDPPGSFYAEVTYQKIDSGTSAVTVPFTTVGVTNWTAPSGIISAFVEAIGGGGAGGAATGNPAAGGGGAGGTYIKKTLTLSAGVGYTVNVGAGGTSSSTTASAGLASWFSTTGTAFAQGGTAGSNATTAIAAAAGSGSTATSIGDVKFAGGNGGVGSTAASSGAGGGGAGSTGAGGNASGSTRGTGTSLFGGNGGSGVAASGVGATGANYGGGGSGGRAGSTTDRAGGAGAKGYVQLTYTIADTSPTVTIYLQEDNGSFAGWNNIATIVNASKTSGIVTRARSLPFTPTAPGLHYRIVSAISNGTNSSYDIYNAKIIADQNQNPADQNTAVINSAGSILGGTGTGVESNQAWGQSFTSSQTSDLQSVDFVIGTNGSPTDALYVELASSSISGTTLGTSNTVPYSSISTPGSYVRFTFPTPISLTAGTKYYYRIFRTAPRTTANTYLVYYSTTPDYTGGGAYTKTNNAWGTESAIQDLLFKNYFSSTTTIGSVETQYLLLNSADSGSTGLQGYPTLWSSSEWAGTTNTYKYSQDATNAADSSKLQDIDNGNADITNATVTGTNQQIASSAFTMPTSGHQLDANVTNTTGVVGAGRIIVASALDAIDAVQTTVPTWQTNDLCVSDRCLYFDGTDNAVVINNTNSIDFDGALANGFSISFWMKATSLGESETGEIFSKNNTYAILSAGSSASLASLTIDVGLTTVDASVRIDDALTLNKWHHVEIGYTDDADDEVTVYIDGVQRGQSTLGSGSPLADTDPLVIGGAPGLTFNGFIDEFKINRQERTAAQVRTDYLLNTTPQGSAASFGRQSTSALNQNLVGYWTLDDTASPAVDSSRSNLSGTWVGNATTATGKFGSAISLDGTGDYVQVSDDDRLSPQDITLSAWIKLSVLPSTLSRSEMILRKADTQTTTSTFNNYQFYVQSTANTLRFEWYQSDNSSKAINGTTALSTNTWYHVVVTKSGTEGRIYLNGVLDGSSSQLTDSTFNSDSNFYIGSNGSGADLKGIVDDVRVYSVGLSPYEARSLYNWGPAPVSFLTFNEGIGNTAADSSGNGNNGTLGTGIGSSAPAWTTGKYGGGLTFDGTTNYALINNTLPVNGANNFTISAWINTTTAKQGEIAQKFTSNNETDFLINNTANKATILLADGVHICSATSTTSINDGQWHNIAATRDVTNNLLTIYIDGKQENQTSSSTCTNSGNPSKFTSIGAGDGGADSTIDSNFFEGKMDEVRIYNYIRSPGQIIEDMNAGHPVGGSPVGSPAIYYKFDEGYGTSTTSVNDSSVNNLTAGFNASNPATWTNDCKFNRCLTFDDTHYGVRRSHVSFLNGATQMSISMWLKPTTLTVNRVLTAQSNIAIGKTSATQNQFVITEDSTTSSEIRVYIASGVTDTSNYCKTSGLGLANGTWDHLAVVYDGTQLATNRIQVYKNGKPVTCTITGTIPTGLTTNTAQFYVGASDGPDIDVFNGSIDEYKLYTTALTQDQVYVDANRGKSMVMGATSTGADGTTPDNSAAREYCIPGDTTSCSVPIAEWKFNEGVGTTANDTSGNNQNGALTNGPVWNTGKVGGGITFDGSNDYINLSNATYYDFGTTTAFTVGAWVKMTSSGSNDRIIAEGVDVGSPYFSFRYTGAANALNAFIGKSGAWCDIYGTTNIQDGLWHYVTAVYNRNNSCTTNDIVMYVDGKKEIETININSGSASSNINEGGITISRSSKAFQGTMDAVTIYNYARTPSQIQWDYNRGAPVAWYRLDECQGTTAYNAALNGNGTALGINGTITIGATGSNTTPGTCNGSSSEAWKNGAIGKINSSLSFDGTDDYITSTYDMDDAQGTYSFATWVKTTSASTSHVISTNSATVGFSESLQISSGIPSICTKNTSNTQFCAAGTSAINDGAFHSIIGTVDWTNAQMKIYVDGQLQGTQTPTGSKRTDNGTMYMGRRADGGSYFNGQIDDVRIYNYALSPVQVRDVYNNGAVSFK